MSRTKKNTPSYRSSKQPVSVLRSVTDNLNVASKPKAIDPRFDRSFGEFHEDQFKAAYEFIKPIQAKERITLEETARKERDPVRKAQMQRVIDQQKSMEKSREQQEFRKNVMKQWKQSEQELVKQGKKPFHLKFADQKKLELIARFKEMKERAASSGQSVDVDKLMEKRRKHKASKQHTGLPERQ